MPTLKPLYDRLVKGKPMVSNKRRTYDSRGFSHMNSRERGESTKSNFTGGTSTVDSGPPRAQCNEGPIFVEHTFDVELGYQESTSNLKPNAT